MIGPISDMTMGPGAAGSAVLGGAGALGGAGVGIRGVCPI